MKTLILLLCFPFCIQAQPPGRQLISLTIIGEPDPTTEGKYYLIVDKPEIVKVKPNQTFLLQSAWHKEGDSIVNIGAGTVTIINEKTLELTATLYPNKIVQEGDMALLLVALDKPTKDTLFFKLARLGIIFSSIEDETFYDRNKLLGDSTAYPTNILLEKMWKDIRRTANALIDIKSPLNQEINKGRYKGRMLFTLMQETTSVEILQFMLYVYTHPDKYKAHTWRVSETFATWLINGAP